ncbi:ATP synthase subunit epsilon, mitochondrial [[Candida] anglica]|uniref:ATP synthase subunit epsilon, mitochondrial n=1 Tax=[Candida] anglica TaxID=148631 RepID=A0ABP0EK16_9ASCO
MSAYKQAGISLNKALAISARAVRSALKPEFKTVADRRGLSEVKAIKIENGVQKEAKSLAE